MKKAACIKSLKNVYSILDMVYQSLQLLSFQYMPHIPHNACGCLQLEACPVPLLPGHTSLCFQLSLRFMETFMTFQANT